MQAVNHRGHSHRAPRQLPKVVAPARHLPTASQVPEFPGSCSPFSPQSLFPWQTPSVCQVESFCKVFREKVSHSVAWYIAVCVVAGAIPTQKLDLV